MPNNLNIHSYRFFCYGITIAFFVIQLSNFVLVKTLLLLDCIENLCYEEIVWRQLELAFFGAVTSVAALFVFTESKKTFKGEKMRKLVLLLLTMTTLCLFVCSGCDNRKENDESDSEPTKISHTIGKTIADAEKVLSDLKAGLFYIEGTPFQAEQEAIESFLVSDRFAPFDIYISPETFPVGVSGRAENLKFSDGWLLTKEGIVYAIYGFTTRTLSEDIVDLLELIGNANLLSPQISDIGEGFYRLTFDFFDYSVQVKAYKYGNESWENWLPCDFIIYSSNLSNDDYYDEAEWNFYEYNPIPFSMEEFCSQTKDDDWYDNGIFSTYMKMIYPNDSWEYSGSFNCYMFTNPYGYTGFEVYSHSCESAQRVYTYLVPISSATAPEVYSFDESSETMKLVFSNGETFD